jgi:hypothetical protein
MGRLFRSDLDAERPPECLGAAFFEMLGYPVRVAPGVLRQIAERSRSEGLLRTGTAQPWAATISSVTRYFVALAQVPVSSGPGGFMNCIEAEKGSQLRIVTWNRLRVHHSAERRPTVRILETVRPY